MSITPFEALILAITSMPYCFIFLNRQKSPLFSDKSHSKIRYFFFLQKVGFACATFAMLLAIITQNKIINTRVDDAAALYVYAATTALITFRAKPAYPPQFDGWLISYFKVRVEELTPYRFTRKPEPRIHPQPHQSGEGFEPVTYHFSRMKILGYLAMGLLIFFALYFILKHENNSIRYALVAVFLAIITFVYMPLTIMHLFRPGYIQVNNEGVEGIILLRRTTVPWSAVESIDLERTMNTSRIVMRGKRRSDVRLVIINGVKGYRNVELHSLLNQWLELYKQREARHNAS